MNVLIKLASFLAGNEKQVLLLYLRETLALLVWFQNHGQHYPLTTWHFIGKICALWSRDRCLSWVYRKYRDRRRLGRGLLPYCYCSYLLSNFSTSGSEHSSFDTVSKNVTPQLALPKLYNTVKKPLAVVILWALKQHNLAKLPKQLSLVSSRVYEYFCKTTIKVASLKMFVCLFFQLVTCRCRAYPG